MLTAVFSELRQFIYNFCARDISPSSCFISENYSIDFDELW